MRPGLARLAQSVVLVTNTEMKVFSRGFTGMKDKGSYPSPPLASLLPL